MAREFRINLTGDAMLGRLIDQLFATHVDNAQDQAHAAAFIARFPHLQQPRYTPASPWGSTLPLFTESDLNLINLETAVTRHSEPWPGKAFNYRMHPANAPPILAAAHIDFASLANNHTLDFGPEGLVETAWTLKNGLFGKNHNRDVGAARVGIAGAGESIQEAISPAALELPRSRSQKGVKQGGRPTALSAEDQKERSEKHIVHVYAASDHPAAWNDVPMFHLIDYSDQSKAHLKRIVEKYSSVLSSSPPSSSSSSPSSTPASLKSEHSDGTAYNSSAVPPSLKIFSIHWGPNYSWHPSDEIRAMARFLIFDCDIDIIHGHSSHHVQGVECPAPGKLIIYGCGDFVDDYAVHARFRNDLGAVYRVIVREENKTDDINDNNNNNNNGGGGGGGGSSSSSKNATGGDVLRRRVVPVRLEMFPTRIQLFQAQLLSNTEDEDHKWVCERIRTLTEELARSGQHRWAGDRNLVRPQLGERGQLIMDLV